MALRRAPHEAGAELGAAPPRRRQQGAPQPVRSPAGSVQIVLQVPDHPPAEVEKGISVREPSASSGSRAAPERRRPVMRAATALCALLLGALCAGFAAAAAPSPLTAWGSAPFLAGAVDAQVITDRLHAASTPCRRRRRSRPLPLRRLPPCPPTPLSLFHAVSAQTTSADAALGTLFAALAESTEQPPPVAVVLVGDSSPAVQEQLGKLASAATASLQLANAVHEVRWIRAGVCWFSCGWGLALFLCHLAVLLSGACAVSNWESCLLPCCSCPATAGRRPPCACVAAAHWRRPPREGALLTACKVCACMQFIAAAMHVLS